MLSIHDHKPQFCPYCYQPATLYIPSSFPVFEVYFTLYFFSDQPFLAHPLSVNDFTSHKAEKTEGIRKLGKKYADSHHYTYLFFSIYTYFWPTDLSTVLPDANTRSHLSRPLKYIDPAPLPVSYIIPHLYKIIFMSIQSYLPSWKICIYVYM